MYCLVSFLIHASTLSWPTSSVDCDNVCHLQQHRHCTAYRVLLFDVSVAGEVFEQVALWQKRPPVPPEMPPDYAGGCALYRVGRRQAQPGRRCTTASGRVYAALDLSGGQAHRYHLVSSTNVPPTVVPAARSCICQSLAYLAHALCCRRQLPLSHNREIFLLSWMALKRYSWKCIGKAHGPVVLPLYLGVCTCVCVAAELTISCWAADPFARPPFSAVQQRLQQLLEHVVLDEQQAQERFVSDL